MNTLNELQLFCGRNEHKQIYLDYNIYAKKKKKRTHSKLGELFFSLFLFSTKTKYMYSINKKKNINKNKN